MCLEKSGEKPTGWVMERSVLYEPYFTIDYNLGYTLGFKHKLLYLLTHVVDWLGHRYCQAA